MQLSLIDYIDSPEFADFLADSEIDVLLVEDEDMCLHSALPRLVLSDKNSLWLQWMVLSACQEYERPLLLLRELPVHYFFPVLSEERLSVINVGVGISSIMVQQRLEHNDVVTMWTQKKNIYEPYDVVSLHHAIVSWWYVRLTHYDVPHQLFAKPRDMEAIMDLTSHQMAWDKATVLVAWSLITSWASCVAVLQEQSIFCDVFLLTDYHVTLTDAIKDSLRQTEHLIVVVDLDPQSLWFDTLTAQLFSTGLFETQVSLITPDYEHLTTINPEYIAEKSRFDIPHLVERVKEVL